MKSPIENTKKGTAVTPVSRLAWQDLMGDADPENLETETETSPNERLLWHTREDHLDVSISPLVPRRGKKRARSSSPVSSPAVEKLRTPAVNVKKLKQALNSPRADPALDLWDRFAVEGPDSKNPLGATNPALAHLMVSSSPRPQKGGSPNHGESVLRRAISCGTHWPKRRRVEAVSENGPVRERGDTTKSSLVTALLESVNGEINKSEEVGDDVGMESPSIKKRRSPRKPRASAEPEGSPLDPATGAARGADSPRGLHLEDPKTPSSDYGDEEFDDSTLWELDASLLSGQVEAGSFTAAENALATGKIQQTRQQASFDDDDEFDDDMDDDLLAAADDMDASLTPKPRSEPAPAPPAETPSLGGGIDDADDIFGDDFGGDFDFEAAELAATQSVGEVASSLMPVRTIR